MRASVMAVTAAGLMLTGCADLPSAPWSKSAAMPTRPSCPAMTNEAWAPIVDRAIHKTFDRDLQKRFGDTAVHKRIAWGKDDKGNTVIAAQRIGPAKYAMPALDQGGEVEVVFQPCTGKLLKTRKLANLEKTPRLMSEDSAPAPEKPSPPRKRGFKWPWKS
ncbi:hypothetical protein [Caulobacter sp. RL271]|uniref:Lipoprotein n=1 Tax=Caulobacter segnis TaxID=88688 RepID=A0ABY4ZYK4_9CAUL|nr:hypothetical protein [Caulobacter segnis]USQ97633.1 hypothetical protein MZV50_08910 [Caulobacter segnis]